MARRKKTAEDRLKALDHFQAQVLLALLHPGNGTLAGPELGGQLALGPALLAPGIPEHGGNVFGSFLRHTPKYITNELCNSRPGPFKAIRRAFTHYMR